MENRIGFDPRLGAYLIDMVLVSVLGWIFSMIFGGLFAGLGASSAGGAEAAAIGGLMGLIAGIAVGFVLAGVLYNLLEAFKGYTLGKLMLGLQIANEDGTQAQTQVLLIRYAIKNIGTILGVLALIPFLFWLATIQWIASIVVIIGCFLVIKEKRQALHDIIGKTAVFKKEDVQ